MIIYNVTVNVNPEIHQDWLSWMQTRHIPDVLKTGFFVSNKLCKVLSEEDTGFTYSVQYTCKSMDDYDQYRKLHAPRLQKEHTDRYKDKFVAFRTLLEVIE